MRALGGAQVGFGRADRIGRSIAHVRHYLGVLGIRDFLVLSADRLAGARSESFATLDEALDRAVHGAPRPRSSVRRLRYLQGYVEGSASA